jgi:acyl carrier protein
MNKDTSSIEQQIKSHLAASLGIEADDIALDDSFTDDLHMQPAEIVDLMQTLATDGIPTDDIDLTTITTVGELVDSLSSEDYTS